MTKNSIKIKTNIGKILVVNCYAPNDNAAKVEYHTKINELIKNTDCTNKCILGDFNTVIDNDKDIISGEKHSIRVVNEFKNMVAECNLIDNWRVFHPHEKEFSWSTKDNKAARRLDYILTSEELFNEVVNCYMISIPFSDHRYVCIDIKNKQIERGPGYWKFNNFLLKDQVFVTLMNELIDNSHTKHRDMQDKQKKWEILKYEIKEKSIEYGKKRKRDQNCRASTLYKQLDEHEKKLGTEPNNEEIISKRNKVKIELELIEDERTKRIQNLARIKWVEEGEKNTAYFMNLEKK